ncbi:Leptomycin B resistance protein pmd1 [Sphaceloma murrayae]|uniref:Leptomycin B resistance protein pmd1 n=1 Tax=Sphaceloma murrayae TaxID=2082308 RepID=A0A2K1R0Z1_9PEZI|nr:Leptomycin B resistance protein pmd1 [Sphaceloma murrayae]
MALIFGEFTTKFTANTTTGANAQGFLNDVNTFVLWFVYLFLGRLVVLYVANMTISTAAIRTTRTIRKQILECTLRQEIWYFDTQTSGSIASQITTNGNRINQGIAEKLATIVSGLAMFFTAFIVSFTVQWKLTLITMCVVPAIIVILSLGIAIGTVQEKRMVEIYSQAAVLAQEVLSSMKTVHAFCAQDKILRRYNALVSAARIHGNKKSPTGGIVAFSQQFCTLGGTALAFWQGFRMFRSGEIDSAGTVLSVVLCITIGAGGMMQILPQLEAIVNAGAAAAEVSSILRKQSHLDPLSTKGEQPSIFQGSIQLQDVHFAYPARASTPVLRGINLAIPAGKKTAIVGASGCGKSTLVALLERWYVPQSGQILLDGKDINSFNIKWLRSNLRLVQQEAVLFRGTVFENVARGLVGAQRDQSKADQMRLVEEACRSSNAHDFIQSLPKGYDTEVGENASMLSGGQKQRITIARSVVSNPKILLLDEATSALDPHAESIVQDALTKVSRDKTTLVIAHKLATIHNADNIAVMSYGRVVEQGTHKDLLAADGQYAALVRAQDLGDDSGSNEARDTEADMEPRNDVAPTQLPSDGGHKRSGTGEQDVPTVPTNESLLSCLSIFLREQKELHRLLLLAIPAAAIAGGIFPAQALLFSELITVFTLPADEAPQRANFFALMLFVIAVVNGLAFLVLGWVCNLISQSSTCRYRSELFEKLIYQSLDFFDRPENVSGALASRLTSVPSALQEVLSLNLFLILMLLVSLFASSALAIAYGWKLGLVVVCTGMPLLMGCGYARVRFEQQLDRETSNRFATSAALATEAVTSIRTVAALTLEDQVCDEYNKILDGILKLTRRTMAWTNLGYAFSQSLEFLLSALGFWYGAQLLASGEYTVRQFFVCFLTVFFGGQAAGQIFGYSMSMTGARSAANYILWLRSTKASITDDEADINTAPTAKDMINVKNIDFYYPQRQSSAALRSVSMQISPGSYLACVGPSGCGKSTFISLLERLYDPNEGSICWNDRNIKSMSLMLHRKAMSLVQQSPVLFQGSVRDNITLGLDYEAPESEILEACRQADALDFISSLPDGLETHCGTKGLQFSGGQRQRIAIARALILNPHVLLLDEATSALDTASERIVQTTLDEAATHRTTVAVAHRLSTIRHADRIFVFHDGQIVEEGTHETLLRSRGRYYQMCLIQSLDNNQVV